MRVVQTTLDTVLIGKLTCLKRLVVDPSAFLQHRIQNTTLAILQVDAVFVGLAHTLQCSTSQRNEQICAPLGESGALHPTAKAGGLYELGL